MSVRCPDCNHWIEEDELPLMSEIKVLCPKCGTTLPLPELTVPFTHSPTLTARDNSGNANQDGRRYSLIALSGNARGNVFPIEKPNVTIGRHHCDINLDDTLISRQHVVISTGGAKPYLEDLGSTNGTFVGQRRIRNTCLEDNSEFRVGRHKFRFVVEKF